MKKVVFVALLIVMGNAKMFAQKPAVVVSDKDGWHKLGRQP
jgi:hypothetical protein